MDVALAIEAIHPRAEYFGVTAVNTREEYENLTWLDDRTKPTWDELKAAYNALPSEEEKLQANLAAKAALLERLGITADEAALLLS
jgi:hypothetical protein